jgi:hypothetical protein
MQTSYFAKYRGPHGVAISLKAPVGFAGRRAIWLAPSWEILTAYKRLARSDPAVARYNFTLDYIKILSHLNPKMVAESLGPDAVLLCWEGPDKFCHRRLIAEWLEAALGIEVPELS